VILRKRLLLAIGLAFSGWFILLALGATLGFFFGRMDFAIQLFGSIGAAIGLSIGFGTLDIAKKHNWGG